MKAKNDKKKVIAHMKIKQEKTGKDDGNELKPLSNFIDDRVALMQQVFQTIKPKKLKSMVPDCLKDMDIDEIKELCLDEVLGISTKRLRSIIQGTECPSDTNSDSDVGEIIEHISLEEISSDDSVTFMSDNETNKNSTGPTPNKEMTVLELVELQARARAIRSQLALEPVKQEIAEAKSKAKANKTSTPKDPPKEAPPVENPNNDNATASTSAKVVRNYRSREKSINKDIVDKTNTEKSVETTKEPEIVKETTKDIAENEEGEIPSSDLESAKEIQTTTKKKKKSRSKRNTSKDNRTRHIEVTGKKNLTVNVSFNDILEKDDDEINLYVSDTEKEQLLKETERRMSNDSESSISIIDLNNSPLVISSESDNDFNDKDGSLEVKKEVMSNKDGGDIQKGNTVEATEENKNCTVDDNSKNDDDHEEEDDGEFSDEALEENTDWKTRWMNSDKVKKVLVTSKLCSNVKKMKKTQKSKEANENEDSVGEEKVEETPVENLNMDITGSVEEFKKLTELSKDQQIVTEEVVVHEKETDDKNVDDKKKNKEKEVEEEGAKDEELKED